MKPFWIGFVAAALVPVPTLLALLCGTIELYWIGLGLLFIWPLFSSRNIWLAAYAVLIAILSMAVAGLIEYEDCCVPFEEKKGPGYPLGLALIMLPPAVAWAGIAFSLVVRGIAACARAFRQTES